jgi:hypothetical protein
VTFNKTPDESGKLAQGGTIMDAQDQSNKKNVPVSFVPTPTSEYRTHRKLLKATVQPGAPVLKPVPIPIPIPKLFPGARVLIYKQDPSVTEIGIRKVFLPGHIFAGPKDARILNGTPGLPVVSPNVFGDMIEPQGTDAFDAVHTFAIVRMTLTMYQRALAIGGIQAPLPWEWNSSTNADPLSVFPHGLPNVMNAYYSRTVKSLKFGDFIPSSGVQRVFTCRSLDIVSHETGHAILDGLKPGWIGSSSLPQTGGLHESFGDLTAIFLTLSQLDEVEAVIAQTKSNLHDKTFLSDLAEQFGDALGYPNGLRNADNDLKLSQAGTEVHAISQVFTGAIYDVLADIFAFERKPAVNDDAAVLYEVGKYVRSLVLRAIMKAPASNATYADVANQMLKIAFQDGKPVQYRNYIRNRFTIREVIVSPTPLTANHDPSHVMKVGIKDAPDAVQDRCTCCGTMQLPEYTGGEEALQAELEEFKKALSNKGQKSQAKHK